MAITSKSRALDDCFCGVTSTIKGVPYIDTSLHTALIEAGKSQGSWFGGKIVLWDQTEDRYIAVSRCYTPFYLGKQRVTATHLKKAFKHRGLSPYTGDYHHNFMAKGILSCMTPSIHRERYAYSILSILHHTTTESRGEFPSQIAQKNAIENELPFDPDVIAADYKPLNENLTKALIEAGEQNLNKGYFERKKVVVYNTNTFHYEVIPKPFFQRYASHLTKVDATFLADEFYKRSLPISLILSDNTPKAKEIIQKRRTLFTMGLLSCFDHVDSSVKLTCYEAFMKLIYATPKKKEAVNSRIDS